VPTVIDPPSGWQYGFPKIVPDGVMKCDTLFRMWIQAQGYPEKDIELAVKYSRYWKVDDEN
jgi:hypothetical protein